MVPVKRSGLMYGKLANERQLAEESEDDREKVSEKKIERSEMKSWCAGADKKIEETEHLDQHADGWGEGSHRRSRRSRAAYSCVR
jgi:hypothetical protein